MTKDETMKLALEALISYGKSPYIKQSHPKRWANGNKAIKNLEEALKQEPDYSICPSCGGMADDPIVPPEHRHNKQEQGEPYGYLKLNTGKFVHEVEGLDPMKDKRYLPLYTTPQPKQEQGEPVAWMDDIKKESHKRFKLPTSQAAFQAGALLAMQYINTTPQQRKPLKDEMAKQMKESCDSMEMRGAFADGWLSAEAAHGIKE